MNQPNEQLTVGTKVMALFDFQVEEGSYAYLKGTKGTVIRKEGDLVIVKFGRDTIEESASRWTPA